MGAQMERGILLIKSRPVVRGFEQTGTDVDTFASTPSLITLLVLITIALARNWFMTTGDVSTAFLHADLSNLLLKSERLERSGDC